MKERAKRTLIANRLYYCRIYCMYFCILQFKERLHYGIIGYIERKPFNIIVLSNIQPFNHMLETIKHMIKPSDKKTFINGLSYEPFTKSNWMESYREPCICRHYKYYRGKIHGLEISMDQ